MVNAIIGLEDRGEKFDDESCRKFVNEMFTEKSIKHLGKIDGFDKRHGGIKGSHTMDSFNKFSEEIRPVRIVNKTKISDGMYVNGVSKNAVKFEELFFDDKEKYAIVIAFFDWMLRSDFKGILNTLAKDMSYGSEVLGCNLPSLFESEEEEGYFDDGVEFYLIDKDIKIDFQMYVKCLELAYKIYVEENGGNEDIKNNLMNIKRRYL